MPNNSTRFSLDLCGPLWSFFDADLRRDRRNFAGRRRIVPAVSRNVAWFSARHALLRRWHVDDWSSGLWAACGQNSQRKWRIDNAKLIKAWRLSASRRTLGSFRKSLRLLHMFWSLGHGPRTASAAPKGWCFLVAFTHSGAFLTQNYLVLNRPNHAIQPTVGQRSAPVCFMRTRPLQATLAPASSGWSCSR